MKTSQKGRDLIREFEGLRLKAYLCSAGVPTIGVGHTKGVKLGDVISSAEADRLLAEDLAEFEAAVSKAVSGAETTQEQYDAMVSIAFNVGAAAFAKSSVVRLHKAGDHEAAAAAFALWNKARNPKTKKLEVSNGLVRRRAAEAALYAAAPEAAAVPEAPKPLVKSRTLVGASLAAAGVTASEVASQLQPLVGMSENVKTLFLVVTVAGLALTAYARFDDRAKGRN